MHFPKQAQPILRNPVSNFTILKKQGIFPSEVRLFFQELTDDTNTLMLNGAGPCRCTCDEVIGTLPRTTTRMGGILTRPPVPPRPANDPDNNNNNNR